MKKRIVLGLLAAQLAAAQGMPEDSPQDLYFQKAAIAVSGVVYDCDTPRPSYVPEDAIYQQACAGSPLEGAEIRAAVDEALSELDSPRAWRDQGAGYSARTFNLPGGELQAVAGGTAGTGYLFMTFVGH